MVGDESIATLAEKDRDVGWIEQLNFAVGGIATEIKLKFRTAVLARHHRRNNFSRAIWGRKPDTLRRDASRILEQPVL